MEEKCTRALRNLLGALCVLCSLSLPLYAESENRLGIRLYGSFLYTDTVPNALFFFSDIEKNDSFELRKALRNHDIDTLVLSSRGGSVWEGLNMAGIIHDKGLTTYVPKLGLEGRGDCASACSFMFFAGKTREAEGEVGVHQFYSGSASESAEVGETEEIAQFTVSEIIGFLNEFETPPFVFERMFQQSKMYYFDNNEMKKIARTVTPLTQGQRSEIEGFINEFLIELAAYEAEEASEAEQKSEPEESPSPKQQPAKEEADTDTQIQIVKGIQTELNRLNCNAGVADGVIGNGTKSALARYAIAAGKFIDESMLQDEEFLLELRESQITCKLPPKSYAQNLVCTGSANPYLIETFTIFDLPFSEDNKTHKFKTCPENGYCTTGSATGGKQESFLQEKKFYRFSVRGTNSLEYFELYYDKNDNPQLYFTKHFIEEKEWKQLKLSFKECRVSSNEQVSLDEPDTDTQIQIVKNIQTELNRLNCNAGVADGVIGNKTKSALARYATAAEKFIDEGMLQDQEFLLELRESQITCKLPSKSYAQNLVCTDPLWATRITKIKIFNVSKLNEGDLYEIEACRDNGSCRKCSHTLNKDTYRDIEEFFKKTGMKLDDWQKGPYHVFGENKLAGVCSKQSFEWYYENKGSPKLIFNGPEAVSGVYYKNCLLEPNTEKIIVRNNPTSSKILAQSYKYETCARISNKRECSTGNLKLQRLKDGEYEFEEDANSREVFYGVVKVKGSEVELQMVDFIEGVAVPINGTGTLNKNNNEIIFPFSDEHIIETFGKAGIVLKTGEITDLTIRWF